jgi:hypothetical protein
MSRITLVLMFLVILIVFSATANAQKERFVGTFATTDANTRGVTRLSISSDGQMHVWGRCHPIDCDWGAVPTDIYGPDVEADLQKSAKAVSAVYNPGFATKIVIVTPLNEDRVRIEVFTRFTDQSHRTAYISRQILAREGEELALKP